MPSRKARFAVLDTSVYIENFRTGRFARQLLESPFVPRCSVVVLHELLRGARRPVELAFVRDLLRHCRVVTPTERHWIEAAEILKHIRDREQYAADKIRDLAFDVLIALSARSIGATLVTCNEADFRAIGRHLAFDAVFWH
ncbi:MAG: PIN domain-containing protein [Candidatus Rokubacteria bacterium]|nr:PIN domain-containing protein [Candidatus Rokubacteria bacterium]